MPACVGKPDLNGLIGIESLYDYFFLCPCFGRSILLDASAVHDNVQENLLKVIRICKDQISWPETWLLFRYPPSSAAG
jgi:hypothetical protein